MKSRDSGALMTVLAGILEDAVKALQRIEKKTEQQGKIFKEIAQKIGKIEKTINTGFMDIKQKGIPTLEKNIIQKISDLGIYDLEQIDTSLDQIIMKIQKSIQILSIQSIVKRIENLATVQTIPSKKTIQTKEKVRKTVPIQTQSSSSKVKTATKAQTNEKVEEKEKIKEESLIKPSSFFGSD